MVDAVFAALKEEMEQCGSHFPPDFKIIADWEQQRFENCLYSNYFDTIIFQRIAFSAAFPYLLLLGCLFSSWPSSAETGCK